MIGAVLLFGFLLLVVLRPLIAWCVTLIEQSPHGWKWKNSLFAATLVLLMICAWVTEFIGVHPILGALLCGVVIPVSLCLSVAFSSPLSLIREIQSSGKSVANSLLTSLRSTSCLFTSPSLVSVSISLFITPSSSCSSLLSLSFSSDTRVSSSVAFLLLS
jgi:hypothetical protein